MEEGWCNRRMRMMMRVFLAVVVVGGLSHGVMAQDVEPKVASQPQAKYSTPSEDPVYGKVRHIGNGVSAPVLIHESYPEYSEEGRRKKISGVVPINLIVDKDGKPQRVRVLRSLGYGLDENAMKAVRRYRFKPAMENGVPVAVEINIDVSFAIQ